MKNRDRRLISAKEITKKFNIPYPTINHYTNLGFFRIVKRKGIKRLYDEREVRLRLNEVSRLIDAGYPLRLIRKKLVS